MNKVAAFFLVAFMFLGLSCNAYAEDVPLLFLENSQSSIESQIIKHCLKTKSWKFSLRFQKSNPDDAYGRSIFNITKDGHKHKLLVIVDTSMAQRKTATREPITMRIKFYIVVPDGAARARNRIEALEWINKWGTKHWAPGKMYLDSDNDVVCEGMMFLTKDAPVHLDQVVKHLDILMETFCEAMNDAKQNGIVM